MTISFSVVQLDDRLSAGASPGWAVVRHEQGQPNRFISRIFLREQDAVEHAHRLSMREVSSARKAAGLPYGISSRLKAEEVLMSPGRIRITSSRLTILRS